MFCGFLNKAKPVGPTDVIAHFYKERDAPLPRPVPKKGVVWGCHRWDHRNAFARFCKNSFTPSRRPHAEANPLKGKDASQSRHNDFVVGTRIASLPARGWTIRYKVESPNAVMAVMRRGQA